VLPRRSRLAFTAFYSVCTTTSATAPADYIQERTSVNINDIIKTTLAMRAYAMETHNIKVNTRLDPDLPQTVADAGQLQQVFLNIILNAETEMAMAHGGGKLSVKTERMDNNIRISFKDDGPGITKDNLDRIFDPFFTTRQVGKGTGLGLSVSHGIVTQHGGKIYARSKLGMGATFIVELPIVTKAEQLTLAELAAESKGISGARILVVDDDLIVRQYLSQILSKEGHSIEIIDNGNDALKRLESEDYDVILLDIKLPGMSGIELYKHLQKKAKPLARRVVFITGDTLSRDTTAFLSKTRSPYITKPFHARQLKNEIDRVISQQSKGFESWRASGID
jgi:CheY-like chemotaxis protein